MPTLLESVEHELYPAWSSGDAGAFEAAVRRLFSPDVVALTWFREREGLESLLDLFLSEYRTWSPQRFEIFRSLDAGDAAFWQYRWEATHSGPLRLHDGRAVPPTGREVRKAGSILARRGPDGLIASWRTFSTYPEIVCEIAGITPAEAKLR